MRRIATLVLTGLMILAVAGVALATPTPSPNGAVVKERVFNDCPLSTFTAINNYPLLIRFTDVGDNCFGFANLHVWRLAVNGVEAVFNNASAFHFCANVMITGDGEGESGLQISPWWSQDVDGRLNVRTTDGEVAAFGGRLPFYSFTAQNGLHYVKGHVINLGVTYLPNGLSQASPATIQYDVMYDGVTYSSPVLAFDQGNPAEDPPHGLWGILNDARIGGHMQVLWASGGNPAATLVVDWSDICFQNLDLVRIENATWGGVKNLYK